MQHYFVQTFDPLAFDLWGLPIRWYGISYIAGFLFGAIILKIERRADPRYPEGFSVSDFLTYAVIGAIAGGRLGEIVFYNSQFYLSHPLEILFLWKGGMASHGGMIGVFMATLIFARMHRMNPLVLLDDVVLAALPGLFLGRVANFINSEMVGSVTDVWWAVVFPIHDLQPRHPVQLYQALAEGPILACILLVALKLKLSPGGLASLFLISYGGLRYLTEAFRELDPAYLGYWHGLSNGQLLSIVMILLGIACLATVDLSKRFRRSLFR